MNVSASLPQSPVSETHLPGHPARVRPSAYSTARRWLAVLSTAWLLAGLTATPAQAHMDTPVTPDNVWRSWNLDPLIIVPLFILTALYLSGLRRIWSAGGQGQGVTTRQAAAFMVGIVTILLALVSPVDRMGGALFSMHMVQHLLLVVVAAPLLVYSAPLAPVLVAMPRRWRRRAGRISGSGTLAAVGEIMLNPFVVWWAQVIVLWLWHVPAFYEAALRNSWVHAAEHLTFLGTALLFWWLVIQPHGRRKMSLGLVVIFIFVTMIQSSALGALLTFAPSTWYAAHAPYVEAWGISPLADQQLAGLIMWVPGGLIYLGAALTAFLLWFRTMDQHHEALSLQERMLDSGSRTDRSRTPRSG